MRYVQSEHIKIANLETKMDTAQELIENYIFDVGLKGKGALRLKLLSEEVLRLAKSIMGYGLMEFWVEGNSRVSYIYLTADNHIDKSKQEELISVSTTGENSMEQGFFGKLVSMFTMEAPGAEKWSLKDYEEELRHKKEEDKYSQEAWADLERSLVAKLADDIEVGINKDKIEMKVTKDFSEALSAIGSRKPQTQTEYTFIESTKLDEAKTLEKGDDLIESLQLSPKDTLHMKLLFEETLGMLKSMTMDYHAEVWFEKYKEECALRLTGKTEMDASKKDSLLKIATDKENTSVHGFMGKVSDIIENSLLNYSEVMSLQQKYGGGYVNYGTMGMYGSVEGMADSGIMWSLYEYKDALTDALDGNDSAKEAWDELEKSIVASLAKDVLVGVKGDRIDITIVYDLNS